MEQTKFVSICCTAYNHERFIRQCLDGFMMQKTDFDFEVLIHDDASTDSTADIIREYEAKYPGIIKSIYQQENQYSKGIPISETYLYPYAKGKYIALCEGDDYWTDPCKLQKQVDFMEANPEFSLCSHRYRIYDEETGQWSPDYGESFFQENTEGIVFDNEFNFNKAWLTKTATVLFRKDAYEVSNLRHYKYFRDVHLFYHVLKKGKGYCFNFDTAVYRKHANGIWSKKNFEYQALIHYKVFRELYQSNRNDLILKKIFLVYFMRYYNSVIKPNLAEKKITKNSLYRLVSFSFDELRYFGLKHVGNKLKNILHL